jgi:TonB-linked SusC/RagA family outer membrane protein
MRRILMALTLLLVGVSAFSQNRQLSGTVQDTKTKDGVASATVRVKGKSAGISTDASGKFTLSVPAGNVTLTISSVGYATQQLTVDANSNSITVMLEESIKSENEIVVTALGIKKEKKALAYSVTQLNGDKFTESRTPNLGNALSGKVAGVNISTPGSGAGGSSRVIIRGGSSLNGNDQPLYVVNGVPIESGNQGSAGMWGGNDAGDGLSAFNPDDIESVSVLKGNTASALYGARASNGVILITTKSGTGRKGMGISFNSNNTIDRVVDRTDFQREYGPGLNGTKPLNQNEALDAGSNHWGTRMDGSQVVQFDGVNRPYSFTGEGINDFYRNGVTTNNTLAFSGGNEAGNYRFSAGDLFTKDIMPNSTFRRNTINFNINSKLKKLTLAVSGQYVKQLAKNRPRQSDSPGNANFSTFMKPSTLPLSVMRGTTDKPGALADGNELRYQGNAFVTNPYWGAYNFFREDNTDRLLGNIMLRYNIKDWLYVQGRVGTDIQTRDDASYTGYGTAFKPRGDYFETFTTNRENNFEAIVGANKKFGDFGVDVMVGGNILRRTFKQKGGGGNDLVVPFVHSVRNVAIPGFSYGFNQFGINSIYTNANISYKNYLFFNASVRQDQFSTLAFENNTLVYPALGASFIISDAFQMPKAISFAKVRTSWAQSGGGGPNPYQLALNYGLTGQGHLGANLGQINNGQIPNQTLQPYTSSEFEIGADVRFLANRFGIDFAFYNRRTTDDILSANISATSGFGNTLVNIGELTNRGFELLINATIIKKKDFTWDASFNYSRNISNVVNLGKSASGSDIKIQNLDESRVRRERIAHIVGQQLGVITGFKHRTNDKGQKMYTPEGYPIATAGYEQIALGRHPVSGGFSNGFTYKNFRLDLLVDFRHGGHLVSGTNYFSYIWGLNKETLNGRNGEIQVSGVLADGVTPISTTITPDRVDDYWTRYAQITENVTYSASFGRLRELSFGYTFPAKMIKKLPIESLSLSFVGRNLALLWSNVPNIDPESGYTVGSNSQGLEFFAMPQARSFGINLSAKF